MGFLPISVLRVLERGFEQYWVTKSHVQRLAKRRGCLLSYSQAEPGRELTQPRKHLLAEPCNWLLFYQIVSRIRAYLSLSLISKSHERRENGGTKLRTAESDTLPSSSPRFAPRILDRSTDDDTFFHYLHLTDLFLDEGEVLDLYSLLKKWSSS